MTDREPTRMTTRRAPTILVGGLLVVVGAVGAAASLGDPVTVGRGLGRGLVLAGGPVSAGVVVIDLRIADRRPPGGQRAAPGELGGVLPAGAPIPRTEHAGALGTSDGVLPDGVTVFDSGYPAVSRLDPALLRALRAGCHRRRR